MNITGLESLVFGVDDLAACRQYLLDYGLDEVDFDPAVGGTWAALDGTSIVARHGSDPTLPPLPPGAHSPCLRETVYGVADAATLDAIEAELRRDRAVTRRDGVLHAVDDMGFGLAFQLSVRRPLDLPVETVIKGRQADYYRLLGEADRAADCTAFIMFLLDAIHDALQQAMAVEPVAATPVETTVEVTVETPDRVLAVLKAHPEMTLVQVAQAIGKSPRAVERAAAGLKQEGRLRFVGAKKKGKWEVVEG